MKSSIQLSWSDAGSSTGHRVLRFPTFCKTNFFLPVSILSAIFIWGPITVSAEVAPVTAFAPEATAWVGQRLPFFIELRAPGLFAGTASFDLPQLPRTLLIKIGEPVVSSQQLEGETWFVQTHEFALFSQESGTLEVPMINVRFARREGFTGPATNVQAQSPAFTVEIRRPPGSSNIGFLITTESLDVTETWEPIPGPAEMGAIFKRTIVQRAQELPGMALAPAPTTSPEGIRTYPGDAATNDKLTRGEFLGERRETITYMVQQPGTLELPAINYVWWNPKTEKLQSKMLPAVTFEAASPTATAAENSTNTRRYWVWLLIAALIVSLIHWRRRHLTTWGRYYWNKLNPPDRVAGRQLLRACRNHEARAAVAAWVEWRNTQEATFHLGSELHGAVLALERHLYGPSSGRTWQGAELARAFQAHLDATTTRHAQESAAILPLLNP